MQTMLMALKTSLLITRTFISKWSWFPFSQTDGYDEAEKGTYSLSFFEIILGSRFFWMGFAMLMMLMALKMLLLITRTLILNWSWFPFSQTG